MKLIRNAEDPFAYEKEEEPELLISLICQYHSCSFIATQDLGKIIGDKFQVLGRIDHSDIRGCSLLVS
jgi:hypothetical protein